MHTPQQHTHQGDVKQASKASVYAIAAAVQQAALQHILACKAVSAHTCDSLHKPICMPIQCVMAIEHAKYTAAALALLSIALGAQIKV